MKISLEVPLGKSPLLAVLHGLWQWDDLVVVWQLFWCRESWARALSCYATLSPCFPPAWQLMHSLSLWSLNCWKIRTKIGMMEKFMALWLYSMYIHFLAEEGSVASQTMWKGEELWAGFPHHDHWPAATSLMFHLKRSTNAGKGMLSRMWGSPLSYHPAYLSRKGEWKNIPCSSLDFQCAYRDNEEWLHLN